MRKVVYLSLGSNLGDRAANLNDAIARLNKIGDVVAESSIYETEPVEFTAQPWFLNCVIAIETEKMPKQLLTAILDIEQQMGRRRNQQKGPRIIDIDTPVRAGAAGGNRCRRSSPGIQTQHA